LLEMLNTHLAQKPFMLGDGLTMADIPMASEIHRWWELPQARADYPHIARWYNQILTHPASKGVFDFPLEPSMYL
jgi:glutathione S-transferase